MTVNQGLGTYSPLVNGKETLVRLYLSKPSCAGSGASIQVTGGTLTVKNGATTLGTVSAPTPVPVSPSFPEIATFSVAPVADSTGDPKFVVPGSVVAQTAAFTASFTATITYQQRASKSAAYASGSISFSTRPGTSSPITANFDRASNALSVLFVPMGDGSKTYSTQWTANAQQAVQDGMTAAVAREYPVPAGIGNLGGTGGLRYAVAPTLIDLARLGLMPNNKFCGSGSNYDLIKAQLAQFRLSYNTANPGAQATRVVGVIDPSIATLPSQGPCFEAMAALNTQEAWAIAEQGKAGQLIGLELAHTFGLVPPNRESPFDGAHSQNITAENPSANRRFNIVQRSFIPTDRSLMKPTATNPTPDNVDTLFEVPDFAFALCILGGTVFPECQTYGQPGSVNAGAPVGSTVAVVMSGSTDGSSGICATCTGSAPGTSVTESYFASSVPLTTPSSTSIYRLVQRNAAGAIVSNLGVPLGFTDSEHGNSSGTTNHQSGLFSFALPFQTTTDRIELWKNSPGTSGALLLYAQSKSQPPQVTGLSVGSPIPFLRTQRKPARIHAPAITQAVETLSAQTDAPTTPTTISPSSSLSTSVSFGNTFSSISSVCVNWYFIGDLFDPGETVFVTLGNSGGGGAGNIVGGSRRSQQLCMGNQADKDVFLDGSEPLTFSVTGGNVTLGAILITVTGDSTAPVGYRISSDATSYTVTQGSSVPIATTVTDDPDAATPPDVDLTAQALVPSGSFSTTPATGTPTFSSDGSVTTSASTPADTYYLVVTGKGGGFNRSYAVPVTVTASGGGGGGGTQPGPTFTVNTASDTAVDAGCTDADCTLREAIEAANGATNGSGPDAIQFDLPDSTEIVLDSPLPQITDPVEIDGANAGSGGGHATVNVGDPNTSAPVYGLQLAAGSGGSTIKGLEIENVHESGEGTPSAAIEIESGGNLIEGNFLHHAYSGIVLSGSEAANNVVGGDSSSGEGNTIWSYDQEGALLDGAGSSNRLSGNTIGLDDGVPAGGAVGVDVQDTPGTVIGTLTIGGPGNPPHVPNPSEGGNLDFRLTNVIGGNSGPGIEISGAPSSGTVVAGNHIGTDSSGESVVGNGGSGVEVDSTSGNQLGPLNTIANNGGAGVRVATGTSDRIVANNIHDNAGLGIELAAGGNGSLAAPTLGAAQVSGGTTTVTGSVDGVPDGDYFVEFFKNSACDPSGSGEGEAYIFDFATVTASGGSGTFSKNLGGLAVDDVVTATLTSTSTNDTSEFSNCVTVQQQQELPPGQEPWSATAHDDHPADVRLDGFLVCPGQPIQVIFVGRAPDSVNPSTGTASFSGALDTSLAPPSCNVKVAATDGFSRTPITDAGVPQTASGDNPAVAAISSPRAGANVLQYGLIPLRGSVFDAKGLLPEAWSLTGPGGLTRSGTGPIVDLQPPSGGWPAGSYTATLKRAGSTNASESDTVTFSVVTDADNDGIPASVESASCFGTGGDSDPTNAYGDQDSDGILNVDDPQPCTPASSYSAIVDVNPDPLPTGSSGNPVTAYVRVPGRNIAQVLASSVRITRIADQDVSSNNNNNFTNTAWTISNGVGTAKFDRQTIVRYLASQNIHNRVISITVGGSGSGPPSWTFSGFDTIFVQG